MERRATPSEPSEPVFSLEAEDSKRLMLPPQGQFYYLRRLIVVTSAAAIALIIVLIITLSITLYRLNDKCPTYTPVNYNVWTQIFPSGGAPQGRFSAGAVAVGSKMYLFGGAYGQTNLNITYQYFNDMWVYDDNDQSWTPIAQQGAVPPPRLFQSMVVMNGNQILLFGGFTAFQNQPGQSAYNDFYQFDTTTNTWYNLTSTSGGLWPSKRGAQGAIWYEGFMYMYGGYEIINVTGQLREMWRFQWSTQTWANLNVSGPQGRIGFSFVLDGEYAYMMDGGCSITDNPYGQCNSIWKYQPSVNVWTQVSTGENKPAARKATNADVSVGGIIYQLFGLNQSGTEVTLFNDVWAYDPTHDLWMEMFPNFNLGR